MTDVRDPAGEEDVSSLLILLLSEAQAGYEAGVLQIGQRWVATLPAAAFVGVTRANLAARVVELLSRDHLDDEQRLQIISDLFALNWWCGIETSDDVGALLSRSARKIFANAQRPFPRPDQPLLHQPDSHALFVGTLQHPLHSPSRGAVNYARALADDPAVARIDLYHRGEFGSEIRAYMEDRLGHIGDRLTLIQANDRGYLPTAIWRGPYVHHFWCEPALSQEISLLSEFGPTVMFVCGDGAPTQFADVYWYLHEPAHIAQAWTRAGAPDLFVRNYVETDGSPIDVARNVEPLKRSEIGLQTEQVVLATVGNRLGVEFDQPFVDGMAAVLRHHPLAHWMVVGPLPAHLLNAFTTAFGAQFSHIPFDRALSRRLAVADIFVNPFRPGGGDSGIFAMLSGAVALTRGDFGDVRAFVPAEHRMAVTAEAFFTQLDHLIENAELRRNWREAQGVRIAQAADEASFTRTLARLSHLAFTRYRERSSESRLSWEGC
jgi:hypothetical protein